MNSQSIPASVLLLIIFLVLLILAFLKNGLKGLELMWEIFFRGKKKEAGNPACCIDVPPELRPRPDPYIYSQRWLMARGLGVTWNNPDFKIVHIATGLEADSSALNPDTEYRIEVTVHNMSTMAAVGTRVSFEIQSFGIEGGIISTPDTVEVNIPAIGSAQCFAIWKTPANVGHICLIAKLQHPDDANPMNNEGQHNTVIVDADNAEKSVHFFMSNKSKAAREIVLTADNYQLPQSAMRAKTAKERQSITYLRRLQAANARKSQSPGDLGFQVTSENGERIEGKITLAAGARVQLTLKPLAGNSPAGKHINITGLHHETGMAIGGITVIYK